MKSKSNIILIFTDQHRLDSLGCYGSPVAKSPNIDSLAADGVLFENAYTVYPVCTPARASLQTGLYPCNHGMQNNMYQPGCVVHELADSPRLLSRQLRKQNYSAGHTGKWHLGFGSASHKDPWYKNHDVEGSLNTVEYPDFYRTGSSLPTDLGYEGDDFPGHGGGGHNYKQYRDYLEENGLEHVLKDETANGTEVLSSEESTIDHFLTRRAIHFIDKFRRRHNPFYFALNYWGPHQPAYVPTGYYERYRNMNLEPWLSFNEDQSEKPSIHNMARGSVNWDKTERSVKHVFAYGEYIDNQIGSLIDYLKREGLYDSSYIIFSCDHGDSLGCHGGLGDKGFHMYEETTHIPLVIKPPKGTSYPKRVSEFVNTTDIYSTILDISGVDKEEHERDGKSLLPLISNETVTDWPDCVVTDFTGLGYAACSQRMIRFRNFKYVFNAGDKGELYNLADDPHELTNLHDDALHIEIRKKMQEKLYNWLIEHNDRFAGLYKRYVEVESR